MPDSSGLWIAAQSPYCREFIDKASGYTVWTEHGTLLSPAVQAAPGVNDQEMTHTAFLLQHEASMENHRQVLIAYGPGARAPTDPFIEAARQLRASVVLRRPADRL